MILYLDTSAYVRYYVREAHHDEIWRTVEASEIVATHLIAFAEMRAAFAKMVRMARLTPEEHAELRQRFDSDWPRLTHVGVDERLVRRAAELAERFGLRGYDSVHLAAAESLWVALRDVDHLFASFDGSLNAAAEALGLPTFALTGAG